MLNKVLFVTDDSVCLPFIKCTQKMGAIIPRPILGDFASGEEIWIIYAGQHRFIYLFTEAFDIGCETGTVTVFDVTISSTKQQQTMCNRNKPIAGIKSHGDQLQLSFSFRRKVALLTEGFKSGYTLKTKGDITPGLLSEEAAGMIVLTLAQKLEYIKLHEIERQKRQNAPALERNSKCQGNKHWYP